MKQFFQWAESGAEPLKSYSIGILAFIMEGAEHASTYKEQNHKLVGYNCAPQYPDEVMSGIIPDFSQIMCAIVWYIIQYYICPWY